MHVLGAKALRVLILGGTSEASKLAGLLAAESGIMAVLSYAGRTTALRAPPIPYRTGGFGGVEGLEHYLRSRRIDVLVDATHPFAEQISRHAQAAAAKAGIPLVVLSRPPWVPEAGDRWIEASTMAEAARALGEAPKRVFLTIGRLQISAFAAAPQHFYLIRTIEPPGPLQNLPRAKVIQGRGPFEADAEVEILRAESIDVIVTKNSGGEAAYAKILAARLLSLPVIMVARPQETAAAAFHDPADVLDFLSRHRAALAPRGV